VVATPDALYLIGIGEHNSDAAMLILWDHPDEPNVLIGVQFAKMAPGEDDGDRRDYTIARRIGAIRRFRGADLESMRMKAQAWVSLDPTGALFPIDRKERVAGKSD
jgi:hypothetical protein